MKIQIMTVTSAMATSWLANNKINRPIRKEHVAKYVTQMASGRWPLTHQGVAIAWDGSLVDGQHRLMAIAQTGRAMEMVVATECDPSIYGYLDQGIVRTASDLLAAHGEAHAKHAAAMARTVMKWGEKQSAPTRTAICEWAISNMRHIKPFLSLSNVKSGSVAGAFTFASIRGVDIDLLEVASERLMSRIGMLEGDPIHALDRALSSHRSQTMDAQKRRFLTTCHALIALNQNRPLFLAKAIEFDRETFSCEFNRSSR